MASIAPLIMDGSVLEGGGQLLRNAVALSALLSRRISIQNIRHSRSPAGLKPQHSTGLYLTANICSAQISGAECGSESIRFDPGPIQTSRRYFADTQTAGSITLLLQIALPCLIFSSSSAAPTELILGGGTNATQAPQIDYTEYVFLPFLRKHFGLLPTLTIRKRGYYPKGGGEVEFSIPPVSGPLPPVTLMERGELKSVMGRAFVAGYRTNVHEKMRDAAIKMLVESGVDPGIIDIATVRERSTDFVGSGSGIILWAETTGGCILGGSAIGLRNRAPARVGEDAATELMLNLEHGGCVDEHLQDQMIIFLALARDRSTVRTGPLTLHTKTAIWVAEQLTDAKFEVQEEADGTTIIHCDGIGYKARW